MSSFFVARLGSITAKAVYRTVRISHRRYIARAKHEYNKGALNECAFTFLFVLNEGVDADVAGVLNGLPGEFAVYHDQAVDGNPRKDKQGKEQHAARGLLGRMAVEF